VPVPAWECADIDGLVALMREDATLSMPSQPAIAGAHAIGAFFAEVLRTTNIAAKATRANGLPAVAMYERAEDGGLRPHRLLVLETDDDRIVRLHAHRDGRLVTAFER
jgi:RNA polymerase sigma-70 factor, ECF subfamily